MEKKTQMRFTDARIVVDKHHVGTTKQRAAAARVLAMFTGSESWDAADAIVGAWLAAAPETTPADIVPLRLVSTPPRPANP